MDRKEGADYYTWLFLLPAIKESGFALWITSQCVNTTMFTCQNEKELRAQMITNEQHPDTHFSNFSAYFHPPFRPQKFLLWFDPTCKLKFHLVPLYDSQSNTVIWRSFFYSNLDLSLWKLNSMFMQQLQTASFKSKQNSKLIRIINYGSVWK